MALRLIDFYRVLSQRVYEKKLSWEEAMGMSNEKVLKLFRQVEANKSFDIVTEALEKLGVEIVFIFREDEDDRG